MAGSTSREVASRPTRPLKRSQSSVSLPTPPRTQKRRTRRMITRSRTSGTLSPDEDEGGDDDKDSDVERGAVTKRRKITRIQEEDEDQDAFWADGVEQASTKPKSSVSEPEMRLNTMDDSDAEETTSFLSRRRMKGSQASSTGSAPVSPPPSYRRPRAAKVATLKRKAIGQPAQSLESIDEESKVEKKEEEKDAKPAVLASPRTPPAALPQTPKAQIRSDFSPINMLRSPENPFLSSPSSPSGADTSLEPLTADFRTGRVFEEKPEIYMVHRGVRRAFPNPHYDHERGKPKSPKPNSLLPPEHPDFSPDLRAEPRNLWPSKKQKRRTLADEMKTPSKKPLSKTPKATSVLNTPPMTVKRNLASKGKGKTRSLVESDDDDDDKLDEEEVIPLRPLRLFPVEESP